MTNTETKFLAFVKSYAEAAILVVIWVSFPTILYFGDSNGFGYFHQPEHDLFWPLVNAALLNGFVFYVNAFALVPQFFHKATWKMYVFYLVVLMGVSIVCKTVLETLIIDLNFPSLASLSFFELALENVYSFIAIFFLSLAYGLGRLAWKYQHQRNDFIDGRIYASLKANLDSDAFINLTSGEKVFRFLLKDIFYLEAQGNYVNVVTKKNSVLIYQSMKKIEDLLPKPLFLRVHRSFIVSLHHFEAADSKSIRVGNKTIPVSQTYREALRKVLKKET